MTTFLPVQRSIDPVPAGRFACSLRQLEEGSLYLRNLNPPYITSFLINHDSEPTLNSHHFKWLKSRQLTDDRPTNVFGIQVRGLLYSCL